MLDLFLQTKDHAQLPRARHPVKLRVSGGPPNYRQSFAPSDPVLARLSDPTSGSLHHSCVGGDSPTRQLLALARYCGNFFGAHELPGGVAKAVMNDLYTSCPWPLGLYLTEETGNNLSTLTAIKQDQLSLESFAESPTPRIGCRLGRLKLAGPRPLLTRPGNQQMTT